MLCDRDPAESEPQGGATIQAVLAGSPAGDAGLMPGDVVIRAAGRPVSGRPDLVAAVRGLRPQDPLDLQYVRDGRTRNVTVTVKAGDPQALLYAPAMG